MFRRRAKAVLESLQFRRPKEFGRKRKGKRMANHADEIKKYAPHAEEAVIAGMLKTYKLVLSKPDAAVVALADAAERETVKKNFLKKKLGLDADDAVLEAALDEVAQKMKGDRRKSRLAVYYLLAEKFGKLDLFKA